MKTTRYFIVLSLTLITILMCGCDKKDCNGDLDGMWQLTLWTGADGDTLATQDSMIFYSFQLQMMKFQKEQKDSSDVGKSFGSMLSCFEKYTSAIRVYNPQNYRSNGHDRIYNDTTIVGNDTIISVSILNKFGVPSDGVMNIVSLSSDELILSSISQGTLRFRKY